MSELALGSVFLRMRTYPKQAPRPKIRKKSARGKSCPAPDLPIAPGLESSFSAKITNIRIVLAMNSLKNWLAFVRKACGYVQNIPGAELEAGWGKTPGWLTSCCTLRRWDCAYPLTVHLVYCSDIVCIHNTGCAKCAQ